MSKRALRRKRKFGEPIGYVIVTTHGDGWAQTRSVPTFKSEREAQSWRDRLDRNVYAYVPKQVSLVAA